MADLRDFNTSVPQESDHASQNGMFLYGDKENNDVILQDADSEIPGGSEPMATGPLSDFHAPQEEESNASGKILAGLVVALMLGAAGVYAYSAGGTMPKQQVASADNGATGMAVKPLRTTPQQAANDTTFTPTQTSAPTPPAAPAPMSEPAKTAPTPTTRVNINSSASNTPRPRVVRTHTASTAPAENASSVDARANATTQAINQSMAENASRNSLPMTSTPDSMSTVQPTAPTTAPTLPSEQPTTPAPQPGEPAPANPVQ